MVKEFSSLNLAFAALCKKISEQLDSPLESIARETAIEKVYSPDCLYNSSLGQASVDVLYGARRRQLADFSAVSGPLYLVVLLVYTSSAA
jgi:hypothetical protein